MKKTFKILSAVTALTMLCTATAPVFTTAADPAPATAVVDEDTSLCGYVLLTTLDLAGAQEMVGEIGTVYAYDTWSAWYPTITVDLYQGEEVWGTALQDNGISLGEQFQPKTCDETAFFVVPKQLEEESVILSCRSLTIQASKEDKLLIACPMYQDAEQSGAYANSAFLKAGQADNKSTETGLASVDIDDAVITLKKYADSLIRPDYVSPVLSHDFYDASPERVDINGDQIVNGSDAFWIIRLYSDQLIVDHTVAFESAIYRQSLAELF